MSAQTALALVKLVHTVVWAIFVVCILAIPIAALAGRLRLALVLSVVVLVEVAILAANHMRCPLTDVAAHYTDDRSDAFDIFLPPWLARHNKEIFGTIFVAGEGVLAWCWLRRPPVER
jgi:hypothetical protein